MAALKEEPKKKRTPWVEQAGLLRRTVRLDVCSYLVRRKVLVFLLEEARGSLRRGQGQKPLRFQRRTASACVSSTGFEPVGARGLNGG